MLMPGAGKCGGCRHDAARHIALNLSSAVQLPGRQVPRFLLSCCTSMSACMHACESEHSRHAPASHALPGRIRLPAGIQALRSSLGGWALAACGNLKASGLNRS
jgi:hypothetical protein